LQLTVNANESDKTFNRVTGIAVRDG